MLLPYPQLSDSLSMPSMHVPVDRELAGKAQFVKSALICDAVFALGSEHS